MLLGKVVIWLEKSETIHVYHSVLISTQSGFSTLISNPAAQKLRERMDKWDCMKLQSFCTTKEMASKLKRLCTEWEIIFASYT
jgi:uncharacterized FlgJ-related protein